MKLREPNTKKYIKARTKRNSETDCWEWQLGLNASGYGKAKRNGKYVAAHRLAYMEYRGPIPDGFLVCHICDVRSCVNPSHLFLGTPARTIPQIWLLREGRQKARNTAMLSSPSPTSPGFFKTCLGIQQRRNFLKSGG